MRSEREVRRARSAPRTAALFRIPEGEGLWRLVGIGLAVLSLLLTLWVAGHVHPEITASSAPEQSAAPGAPAGGAGRSEDLSGRFAQAVDNEIRRLQLLGKMPTGFLGEFAKKGIKEDAKAHLDQIQKFVKDFALSDGEKNTQHLDFVSEFGKGGENELKVRFVAEVQNWNDEGGEVSVLVAGWLGEKVPELPTDKCFDAFLAYLMGLYSKKCTAKRLKVGVVDLGNGTTCAWTWSGIDAKKAGEYLETLARSFLRYEQTDDGKMVDFTSKKLLKALNASKKPYAWDEILEKATAEEYDNSSSTFNNDLVLEQNLERFKREPGTGVELKGIFENRYQLPLGGRRLEVAEEEVKHE